MLERLGATVVCVMNVSGSDPDGLIRMYGERVLPELRGQDGAGVSPATDAGSRDAPDRKGVTTWHYSERS